MTLRIFSTAVVDSEKEGRGPGVSSVFCERQRFHSHTFNNKGQNYMEYKLNDLLSGHMHGHRLLDNILLPLLPDKDQSSVIFASERDQ